MKIDKIIRINNTFFNLFFLIILPPFYNIQKKQILAVVNFPPRQIANFMSEVLVLGTYSDQGVVLIRPDNLVSNGDKLG